MNHSRKFHTNALRKTAFCLFVTLLFISFCSASEYKRTWRTKQGGFMEATWNGEVRDGKITLVSAANGKSHTFPVDNLKDDDLEYIKNIQEKKQGRTITVAPPVVRPKPPKEGPGRKIAFLVGVNDYPILNQPLDYCVSDVQAIEKRLLEIGFEKKNIFTYTDLTDEELDEKLKELEESLNENDFVFLFFSGHGVNLGGESYFCLKNTDTKIEDKYESGGGTRRVIVDAPHSFPIQSIIERIGSTPALLKYFVFDMCRSGGDKTKKLNIIPEGTVVSLACSDGEQSNEPKELGHGLFCYYLLEGLVGNADTNKDWIITLPELHAYVEKETKKRAEELHQRNPGYFPQKPQFSGDFPETLSTSFAILTAKQYGVKRTKTINGVDYTFCWCPSGTVTVGDDKFTPASLRGPNWNQKPKVETLPGFWILETEVTQEMWKSVMQEGNPEWRFSENRAWSATYILHDPKAPMCCITPEEAEEFCQELGLLLHENVSLPSEAQWTYASLSGIEGGYEDRLDQMAWYNVDRSNGMMHEVKTRMPNAWGVYDMFGNVQELTSDMKSDRYRLVKGGHWLSDAGQCTPGSRDGIFETNNEPTTGFRPVLIPTGNDFGKGFLRTDPL